MRGPLGGPDAGRRPGTEYRRRQASDTGPCVPSGPRANGRYSAGMRMTSRLGTRVVPAVMRLVVVVALVVSVGPLAPPSAAQSHRPRFERTACWVDGDWARGVQRECGWLV